MASLGTAQGNIVISTAQFQQAVQQVQQGSAQMTRALAAIGVGVTFEGIKRLGEAAFDLAKTAAQADLTRDSFKTLASGVNENADDMLSAMRDASRGMVSDNNLILDANRALLLGVAKNTKEIVTLLDVARVRGQAAGLSLSESFDKLITGLGRNSPKILDDLLIKGGQQALDGFAASLGKTTGQLSAAQQQAFLFNYVLKSTQPLLDADKDSANSAAVKFQQFGADLENAKQKLGEFLLAAGATDALDTLSTSIDNSIKQIQTLEDAFAEAGKNNFGIPQSFIDTLEQINAQLERWQRFEGHFGFQAGNFVEGVTGSRFGLRSDDPQATGGGFGSANPITGAPIGGGSGGASSGPVPIPASTINPQDVINAQVENYKKLGEINRDTNKQIQQATEDAGRQRAETIRSYELGIVREEQDFGIQRARQERDYEKSISLLMRDAAQRDAQITASLNENIATQRSDNNKQLARQEEDFQTSRLRALQAHSDDLLDAAGRLDAAAVYKSQRDFARQEQQSDEDHAKQLKRDAEDQGEREAQERKSAQKQIDEARQADDQRLADMRDAFAQQKADEDADRTLRQARALDDYQHQLDEQDTQEGLRIQQIQDNAAEQRSAQQDAFDAQLTDLGLFNTAYHNAQLAQQKQAIEDLAPLMKDWFNTQVDAMRAATQGPRPQWPSLRDPTSINSLPTVGGVHLPSTNSASSSYSNNNSRSFSVGDISISVSGGANLTQDQLENAIYGAIIKLEQAA